MTTLPASGDSSVRAARSLVDAFLAEDPLWQEWKGDGATILDVGDQEDHLVLAVRKGVVTFETISRDHRYLTAEFGRELDAWRFLIMQLGDSWRSDRRMRDINPRKLGLAPGTTLERGPSGYWLTWPGGAAIFHSDLDAIGFSWVAQAEPADIAASYRHVNGEPLFDLGLPVEAQGPTPPAPRRVMAPPPVETPPPDDLDPADLAVIDAVAAELQWARRPATRAETLSVGDDQVGRAISYRQSQFLYEHIVGRDWRKTECTFSTAAGARRFLIAELGGILRMRTRMRTIRPRLAAPDCQIERGPTGFLVTSPAGQATFRLGLGHGQALVFSWVAAESLASIAASYRDPDGRPVFTTGCLLPSPYERPPPSPYATEPAPGETGTASMGVEDDDPELAADLVVIDDFLARDLLWSRRPGVDPLVLDIATFSTEWVLARTDSGYTIEHRRRRQVLGTFSSARGARRYAIMELGRLWRQSHGLKSIWPKHPAPGSRLQKLPDGYRLTWNGGEARFGMDSDAIRFSWIATAELADIAASFIHPNGEPLLDLSRPPPPPAD
jgi:hypothetical protein